MIGVAGLMAVITPAYANNAEQKSDLTILAELEESLFSMVNQNSGEYGIAVLDLQTSHGTGVNLDMPFPMASTMKVAVAAAYLDRVEKGERDLYQTIGGSNAYSLIEAMIIRSDNYATDRLIANLGGAQEIDIWLKSKGAMGIRVDRNIAQLLAAPRNLWEHKDTSTPRAMVTFLAKLDRAEIVSRQSRDIIMDMMRRCQTGSNRIKGLLPAGTIVEHKTGTLRNYTSDIGFLTLPNGKRIAVVFFARGGVNRPAVIATAARKIHDAYSGNSPVDRILDWNPDYSAYSRTPQAEEVEGSQ